ncbi:3-oxoacyl-reductase [Halenospora varia]|nr:3-oxoacyl-reductase [Halenospora varia]
MTSLLPLSGKVIAITGAASGIGLATAHLLASRGAILSLADLQDAALSTAAASISEKYPNTQIHTFPLDVRSAASVDAWIAAIVEKFSRLDGAANLAGVIGKSIGIGGIADIEENEWDFIIGVNLTGVMHCLRAEMKVISEGGSIVNAASIAGLMGRANNGAYAASKHGVIGLTKSAAKEIGVKGVRVNSIAPGRIDTPMSMTARSTDTVAITKEATDIALRRNGKADEVASLIAFLLGDESKYISGGTHSIDGGWFC